MSKVTQREAVYSAIVNVFAEHSIKFEDGMNAKDMLTKDMRGIVNTILASGFVDGRIELKDTESNREKLSDPSLMKEYVSGLQSNWLMKDTRLNGNVDHEIKNPGSRTGTTDPQVKALRALIKMATTSAEIAELQSYVDKRLAEIHVDSPKKTVAVNFDDLPPELQAKYSNQ